MRSKILSAVTHSMLILILGLAVPAHGYDLTQAIQKDLVALGYEPGNVDGEATTQTIVAIAKFEAEHDMEVTARITPQLAGILSAEVSKLHREAAAATENPAATTAAGATVSAGPGVTEAAAPTAVESATAAVDDTTPPPAEALDPQALKAAQQQCIQEKMDEARKADKKRKGFGALMSAVSRTAGATGNDDIAASAGAVYDANATAADVSAAAKDLGLTEDEIAACENPT